MTNCRGRPFSFGILKFILLLLLLQARAIARQTSYRYDKCKVFLSPFFYKYYVYPNYYYDFLTCLFKRLPTQAFTFTNISFYFHFILSYLFDKIDFVLQSNFANSLTPWTVQTTVRSQVSVGYISAPREARETLCHRSFRSHISSFFFWGGGDEEGQPDRGTGKMRETYRRNLSWDTVNYARTTYRKWVH